MNSSVYRLLTLSSSLNSSSSNGGKFPEHNDFESAVPGTTVSVYKVYNMLGCKSWTHDYFSHASGTKVIIVPIARSDLSCAES